MAVVKKYNFTNASDLIEFICKNTDLIKEEKVKSVYQTGACSQFNIEDIKMCSSDESIVIEFNSYAILLDYMDISDIWMTIIDSENFYNGKLIIDSPYKDFFVPEKDDELTDFRVFDQEITDVLVERFSHSFDIDPSGTEKAIEGGDYFASIIVMMGDIGLYVCAEEALFDGYMDFGIVHRNNIDKLNSGMNGAYERIIV